MHVYVLDTSAILALLNGEPGHETVRDILVQAREPGTTAVYVPFIALMETEYLMMRRHSEESAARYMKLVLGWPARVVESDPAWCHGSAIIKASGRLSLADAWIAALALSLGASLVHKDPEFDRIKTLQTLRVS